MKVTEYLKLVGYSKVARTKFGQAGTHTWLIAELTRGYGLFICERKLVDWPHKMAHIHMLVHNMF